MVRFLTVLFISSVFVFGLCKGESEEKKKLNLDIEKTRKNIASVNEANEKLSEEISKETKLYKSKIKIKDDLKNKGNAENQKQHKELEKLYHQLMASYLKEDVLKEAPKNIDKLKLGIKVTEENIKILEARRAHGIAKLCMELEDMAENSTDNRMPSALALVRIEDTIVLKNKLRLLLTELARANDKKMELKMQLKSIREFYHQYNKDLNAVIEKIGEDHKKGQESIDKIKKALEVQKKRVEELEKSSGTTKKELDKWKKEAKKVLDKYEMYTLDVECYRKLHSDIVTLVYPNSR